MNTIRTLRIAGIQAESRNFDAQGNLRRAEAHVEVAAGRGAELVLCPELLAAGYLYARSIWDVAEPCGGPTELWLARMARLHRLYIGASYLETAGSDFFNTFTLMNPDGAVAGRVRKESLPGFEGWFFRGCSGPKVIETDLGRIAVGICHDNNTARFMRKLCGERIDLLLMPHSAPCIGMGPLRIVGTWQRELLRSLAGFYSGAFGVPTMMVNKAAGDDSSSPVPWVPLVRLRFHFVGQSTICDADGKVCDQLDEQEGVVTGEVVLDPRRKREPAQLPSGYWSRPPPQFPRTWGTLFRVLERAGKVAYALSRSRGLAARRIAAACRAEPSCSTESDAERTDGPNCEATRG